MFWWVADAACHCSLVGQPHSSSYSVLNTIVWFPLVLPVLVIFVLHKRTSVEMRHRVLFNFFVGNVGSEMRSKLRVRTDWDSSLCLAQNAAHVWRSYHPDHRNPQIEVLQIDRDGVWVLVA